MTIIDFNYRLTIQFYQSQGLTVKLLLTIISSISLLFSVKAASVIPINDKLIETLSARMDIQDAKISPDGRYIAIAIVRDNKRTISVLDLTTNTFTTHSQLPGNNEYGSFHWASSSRIVAQVMLRSNWQEQPFDYGELFAFNVDGSKSKLVYGYRTGSMQTGTAIKQRESTYGWAQLIDPLVDDEDHILIASTPMSENKAEQPRILKWNIHKGKRATRIAKSPVAYGNYISHKQQLSIAHGLDLKTNKYKTFLYLGKKQWQELVALNSIDNVKPISFSEDKSTLYFLANHTSDKLGLHKLNLKTNTIKTLYNDQHVDISSVATTSTSNILYSLGIENGLPEYLMVNKKPAEAVAFRTLLASFPGYEVGITSASKDNSKFVFKVESDVSPVSFYMYDTNKGELKSLYKSKSALAKTPLKPSQPFSLKTTDNINVSGYFTEATNYTSGAKNKLVVLVHGGPAAKDSWAFDDEVHLFSQHGYSVLRVNFRGSIGFGHEFMTAANGKWATTVQQDIYEATQWAIKEFNIATNSVCIFGHSFGGYSAIMSAIKYPDTYNCAVSSMGVYSIPLLLNDSDALELIGSKSQILSMVGSNEKEQLNASPVSHIGKLNTPLFIAHGLKDERTPISQFWQFKDKLDSAGKEYQELVFKKEGHGFYAPQNKHKFYREVLAFLNNHIP